MTNVIKENVNTENSCENNNND